MSAAIVASCNFVQHNFPTENKNNNPKEALGGYFEWASWVCFATS
jgi:hypothetical protein